MLSLHLGANELTLLQWVLVGAFLDAAFGVGASFKAGTFDLALLGNFLVTNVAKVLAPVVFLGVLAVTTPGNSVFHLAFVAACWTAYAAFLGMILAKLGLPVALANAAVQAAKKALGGA